LYNILNEVDLRNISYEIIIVDVMTNNIEKIKEIIPEKYLKNIKIIHFEKDIGYPAQRNVGFTASSITSKYIIFIDNDVVLSKNVIKCLIDILNRDPKVGAVQPMLIKYPSKNKDIDCLGGFLDYLGYSYFCPIPFSISYLKIIKKNIKMLDSFYCAGAFIVAKRCVLEELSKNNLSKIFGPFDSDYFMCYEDVDFSWRIRLLGYKVYTVPNCFAFHERRMSKKLRNVGYKVVYYNTKNRLITLIKCYELKNLLCFLCLLLFLEIVKSLAILFFARKLDHFLATIKSIIDVFFRDLRIVYIKRHYVQQSRKVDDVTIMRYLGRPHLIHLIKNFKMHYK